MLSWLYELPLGSLAVLAAIIFVGIAWFGAIFLRPFLRLFVRSRTEGNEVVGYILSSFGVLYGILLGLTAVAAYQNWAQVDANLTTEAAALVSVYQAASTFPEPDREELRGALLDLSKYAIEEEWPLIRKGLATPGGRAKTAAIESRLLAFEPQSESQARVHGRAIDQFYTFLEQRRLRIYSAGSGIPAALWYVVIVGAAINMVLIWVLDTRIITQLFLGGLLAFFLGAMILLIAVLAKPFQSDAGISPDALRAAYEFMAKGDGMPASGGG